MEDLELPQSYSKWLVLANSHKVESTSICELDALNSGSKIELKQFLTLHVLWASHKSDKFEFEKWGIHYRSACQTLEKNQFWMSYVTEVERGLKRKPEVGTFDMIYELQSEISTLKSTAPETEKVFSPRYFTRSRAAKIARQEAPSTPTPLPPHSTTDYQDLEKQLREKLCINEENPETPLSVATTSTFEAVSPARPEGDNNLPIVYDEQLVNTALFILLRSLCLRAPDIEKSKWTLERKSFNFGRHKDGDKLYQARCDGHLMVPIDQVQRSLAILEVKARDRNLASPRMQESAQMVAWIYSEKDLEDDKIYHRCMLSQDHEEIYLIIASYDKDYIRYLNGHWKKEEPPSFLTMREIGPFIPTATGHMRRLGGILVALTQQLEKQAVQGKPCRW